MPSSPELAPAAWTGEGTQHPSDGDEQLPVPWLSEQTTGFMLNTSLPAGRLQFGGHARQTALMRPAPNKTPGAECPRSFPGGHCCPRGRTSRCWRSYVCLLRRLQGASTPASLCLDSFGLHPTRLCALLTLLHVLPWV